MGRLRRQCPGSSPRRLLRGPTDARRGPAYAAATEDPDDEDEDDDGPTRAFVVKGGGARRVHVVVALNGDLHAHTFRNDADSDAWVDAGEYETPVSMTRKSPARSSKNRVSTSTPSSPTHTE